LKILAPAKLNLTLEVLGKRRDGFHEIRSVIQTINLADRFDFQAGEETEFVSDMPGWAADRSLVSKAADLLKQVTGCSRGVTVAVEKRIPLLSGLGGDSSGAAATLIGLNRFWELDLSREELTKLAQELGSDVAFFLYGGTALVEGRGEVVTPLPPLPDTQVLLVMPDISRPPGKTGQLYAALRAGHFTDGGITRRLTDGLKKGDQFTSSLLFNTFENVAFNRFSELKVYREHIKKVGVDNIHLAGSGPALFTLVEDRAQAEDLFVRLKQQGLETYLVDTLPAVDIERAG